MKKMKKLKSLSLKEKVDIIREIEITKIQTSIVKRGVASKSTVSRIWSERDAILEAYAILPEKTYKIKKPKHDIVNRKH
ncbi:hypothetical protein H311_02583 [Anncaliia algerae PRA109]|nr:hypothetical protein H311_02583 [Anncaliia algerae PRA109]